MDEKSVFMGYSVHGFLKLFPAQAYPISSFMNPKTSIILHYLTRLRSRTRWLQFGSTTAQTASVVLLLLGGAAVSLSLGSALDLTRILFFILLIVGVLCTGVWGVLRQRRWKNIESHAHYVERLFPVFRGRLQLAMNHQIQGAVFLAERIRASAVELSAKITPAQIHTSQPLKANIWRALGVVVLIVFFEILLPISPSTALAAFRTGEMPLSEIGTIETVSEDRDVLLGDIMLRYTFPEHTRMTPIDVPNSDGAIHGPVGSTVLISARADKRYRAAALVIDEKEPEAVMLTNGRNVQFSITIADNSEWKLLFQEAEEDWYSTTTFPIQVDDDDPPIVTITEPMAKSQVPINTAFKIPWTVTDDFGIERIAVEVTVGGKTSTQLLEQPESLRLMIDGRLRTSPAALGLRPGDEVELQLVAYDNQAPILLDGEAPVSSSDDNAPIGKRGESVVMSFTVMGPKLSAQRLLELNQKLKELLIPALADFLMDPMPPSAKPSGMVRWVKNADDRLEPLQTFIESEWGDAPPSDMSTELVFAVLDNASRLFRFTYSTYDLRTGGPQPKIEDVDTFRELHESEVASIEKAVYLIDMMLRQVASRQVSSLVKQLDERAESLERNPLDEENSEAQARALEQIEQLMSDLDEQSKALGDGALRPFVQSRNREAQQLLEAAKEALAENTPQAKDLQQQLAINISQLADGVEEQRLRQENKQEEMMDFIKEVMEKLEATQAEQEQMANGLDERRQSSGTAEQQANIWEEIERLSDASVADADLMLQVVGSGEGFHPRAIRYTENISIHLNMLLRAVRAREQADAIDKLSKADLSIDLASGMYRRSNMPAEKMSQLNQYSGQIQQRDARTLELLNQMQDLQNDADPSNELAQQQQPQQSYLQEQMNSLLKDIEKIEQTLPTADGSASEFGEQAKQDMGDALKYMGRGRGMSAEGMERGAAQNIQNTIDRLQQQLNEYMQMQQQMQQMDPSDSSGESESPSQDDDNDMSLRPASSQFNTLEDEKTPEEYRQELLEGMASDVPEEYRQQKKRYYEELVQQ